MQFTTRGFGFMFTNTESEIAHGIKVPGKGTVISNSNTPESVIVDVGR